MEMGGAPDREPQKSKPQKLLPQSSWEIETENEGSQKPLGVLSCQSRCREDPAAALGSQDVGTQNFCH